MKFSIAIPPLENENSEKYIALAKKFGYDGVEPLVANPSHTAKTEMFKALLEKYEIDFSGTRTGLAYKNENICLSSDDHIVRNKAVGRLKEHILFASDVSCSSKSPRANVLVGLIQGRLNGGGCKDARKRIINALRKIDSEAGKQGVKIGLEPVNRYEMDYHNTAADVMGVLDEAGCRNTGILIDTFHMNIEESDISEAVRISAPKLVHVHVADSNRRAPGSGHIDFDSFFCELKKSGYNGWVTVEADESPSFKIMAQKAMEFLEKYRG